MTQGIGQEPLAIRLRLEVAFLMLACVVGTVIFEGAPDAQLEDSEGNRDIESRKRRMLLIQRLPYLSFHETLGTALSLSGELFLRNCPFREEALALVQERNCECDDSGEW